jgi:hypothetical protein
MLDSEQVAELQASLTLWSQRLYSTPPQTTDPQAKGGESESGYPVTTGGSIFGSLVSPGTVPVQGPVSPTGARSTRLSVEPGSPPFDSLSGAAG